MYRSRVGWIKRIFDQILTSKQVIYKFGIYFKYCNQTTRYNLSDTNCIVLNVQYLKFKFTKTIEEKRCKYISSRYKYEDNNEFPMNIVISISEFINNNSLVDSLFSLDKIAI